VCVRGLGIFDLKLFKFHLLYNYLYSAWEKILLKDEVRKHLSTTNVIIAPHHGRENGYHEAIFAHCKPEVIVISDKEIMHGTQDGMAQKYSNHVTGQGIYYNGVQRRVLTTRTDGHILINFGLDGSREYVPLLVD